MAHNPTQIRATDQNRPSTYRRKVAQIAGDDRLSASEAAFACFKEYAKEHPEMVALWAFGMGFVLGWKLKPW
jgi:hypothetical protein